MTQQSFLLSILFPAVFVWRLNGLEWVGGGLVLAGLAVALWPAGKRAAAGETTGRAG